MLRRNVLFLSALFALLPLAGWSQDRNQDRSQGWDSRARLSEELGFDRRGGDFDHFRARDLDDCQRFCRQDRRCVAYSYLRSSRTCYLKDRVYSAQRSPDAVTGIKGGSQNPPGRPGLTEEPGLDRRGSDYTSFRVVDGERCRQACADDRRCQAYSYLRNTKTCYLKDRINPPQPNRDAVTGIRTGGGYPNPGYPGQGNSRVTEEPGIDRRGNDYTRTRVRDLRDCKRLCAGDERCRAYTFLYETNTCYLKDRVNPGQRSRDAVSGVKDYDYSPR